MNRKSRIACGVIAVLLIIAATAAATIFVSRVIAERTRYAACLADSDFAESWQSSTPIAEIPSDGVGGDYITHYYENGYYVVTYASSDMMLVYSPFTDHIRQYDSGNLTVLSVGKYQDGLHTYKLYSIAR